MTTVLVNPGNSLNSGGIKRKRTAGIKYIAANISVDAVSATSVDEDRFSDTITDEGMVSDQSSTCTDESSVSRKKKRRVQEPPLPSEASSRLAKKVYNCPFEGCQKAYTKPARLEEHKRSHTGERPFKCIHPGCQNAYLRESHLQAHARTHRAYSERPLLCPEGKCEKRFWTSTQLEIHQNTHKIVLKPFKCAAGDCPEAFLKHHQLRAHVASAHCPPGTKNFRCERDNCIKSFSTSQKLRAHLKVHQADRYVCATEHCLSDPQYFQNWSLLQAHIRIVHPPTCPYPGCENKKFASQKNFKAHLKVHEERDIQETLEDGMECDGVYDEQQCPRGKTVEVGRDWKCEWEECKKAFKSKKAMNVHINVSHREQRDFKCEQAECGRAFGYKHLLQRHMAKIHGVHSEGQDSSEGSESSRGSFTRKQKAPKRSTTTEPSFIEALTGKAYKRRGEEPESSSEVAKRAKTARKVIRCPWPHFTLPNSDRNNGMERDVRVSPACEAIFHRAYDLRRHLKADHALAVEKAELAAWLSHDPQM